MAQPQFLSPRETAQALGLSLATVRRHLATNAIPHQKIGKAVRIPSAWIDQMVRKTLVGFDKAE